MCAHIYTYGLIVWIIERCHIHIPNTTVFYNHGGNNKYFLKKKSNTNKYDIWSIQWYVTFRLQLIWEIK